MREQVNSAATDVVPASVNGADINSGNFFKIGGTDITKDPITIGLGARIDPEDKKPIRLTGCTALIVMSQKAVWYGHFWERLSYGDNELFKTEVLDFITNGGTQNSDVQQAIKDHADDFKGQASASAWILYPEADEWINPDDPKASPVPMDYKDMNTKLQDEVKQLIDITATMTIYKPEFSATNGALGRALYQYDPEAKAEDPKRGFRFIHDYTDEGITYF